MLTGNDVHWETKKKTLRVVSVVPPVTPWWVVTAGTPSTNCEKERANQRVCHIFHNPWKICCVLSKSDSDLSPAIMPAGINFPDFLYLIPITTERTPEATGRKKTSWYDTACMFQPILRKISTLHWAYSHNETLMSFESLETLSAPYADNPPKTKPAIRDITLPTRKHRMIIRVNYYITHENPFGWYEGLSSVLVFDLFSCIP